MSATGSSSRALRVYLVALKCPLFVGGDGEEALNSLYDASSAKHLQKLIVWLEDRVVRHLPIDDRASLRADCTDRTAWLASYAAYLKQVGCPAELDASKNLHDCTVWLLSHAIALVYEDSSSEYNLGARKFAGGVAETTPAMDVEDAEITPDEVKQKVREILRETLLWADAQRGAFDAEELEKMRAICARIEEKIVSGADGIEEEGDVVNAMELGFTMSSEKLNRAAKVLKMLYVSDMSELQRGINSIFATCQSFTANPKVNSSLGKVGR